MNFQTTFQPEETFKTTTKQGFKPLAEREEKFKLKDNALTADKDALQEYREKWTSSNHNFARTYLGAPAYKKSL